MESDKFSSKNLPQKHCKTLETGKHLCWAAHDMFQVGDLILYTVQNILKTLRLKHVHNISIQLVLHLTFSNL